MVKDLFLWILFPSILCIYGEQTVNSSVFDAKNDTEVDKVIAPVFNVSTIAADSFEKDFSEFEKQEKYDEINDESVHLESLDKGQESIKTTADTSNYPTSQNQSTNVELTKHGDDATQLLEILLLETEKDDVINEPSNKIVGTTLQLKPSDNDGEKSSFNTNVSLDLSKSSTMESDDIDLVSTSATSTAKPIDTITHGSETDLLEHSTNEQSTSTVGLLQSTEPTQSNRKQSNAPEFNNKSPLKVTETSNRKPISREFCYKRPIIELCHTLPNEKRMELFEKGTHGAWYYDPVEMGCHYTSDCILNDNNFKSQEDCESTCMPLSGPSRCLAPPKAGYFQCSEANSTRAIIPLLMIFFDKTTGKCRWFTYYGCGGSANRFHSISECEATCGEKVASKIFTVSSALCRIAPSNEHQHSWPDIHWTDFPTENQTQEAENIVLNNFSSENAKSIEPSCPNIGQAESRWYLDINTGTCKEFAYTHCGGSANNFITRTDCEQFCGAKKESPEEICLQDAHVGECNSCRQMWYFDSHFIIRKDFGEQMMKGDCRTFNYSGCGGNSNRFSDRTTCEHTCNHLRSEITITETTILNDTEAATLYQKGEAHPLDSLKDAKGFNITNQTSQTERLETTNVGFVQSKKHLELLNIDFEPCRRAPVFGHCRPLNCSASSNESTNCKPLAFQRWFFNAHTSNCEPFKYSGCGGSENTFDDAQSCQEACKSRIVRPDRDRRCDSLPHHTKCYSLSLGHAPGSASNSTVAFHFSLESATCKAFHLDLSRPECDVLSYFSNGHECLQACVRSTPTERHLQNRCFARKTHATWTCNSEDEKTFRWSYISELNQCVQFSQCMPNANSSIQPGNNFASRSICETTCMARSFEEVCQLPAERGPCHATQARYFYDIKSGRCRMFLYGGCLGNANRFLSRHACESACGRFTSFVINRNETMTTVHMVEETSGKDAVPLVPAEVFDRMRRITQRHTDHFPWDMCLESHWYGTCPVSPGYHAISSGFPFTQLTRYFYDRRLGKCQPFTYTGCGARANHFDTIKGCKEVCEERLRNPKSARCGEINRKKLCTGSGIHAWAFNHSIGDCHSIEVCPANVVLDSSDPSFTSWTSLRRRRTDHWLGIFQAATGQLPLGIYATRGACQYHCLPKPPRGTDAQNVCHMNPIVTVPFGCNAMVTRWYFEPREATCRSYITCPQYGNNFPSEQACRSICVPTHPLDVCRLPRDHGGCSQFQTRWHYDMTKRACLPFTYGGCFGNSNRFLSRTECESFCSAQDVCRLPLQRNSTDPTYPKRYFYDQETRKCRPFYFTGILAHGNNFPTLESCNATCIFVPDLDVIAAVVDAEEPPPPKMQKSETEDGQTLTASTKDIVPSRSDSRSTDIFVTGHKSLCIVSLADLGANELFEQTICEPEDIIHELGHRFRPITKKANGGEEVDGVCEQTLVPICLSEPRRVFGTIVDPMMQTIGRVFRSQAECEEICLNARRVRRSISPSDEEVNVEHTIMNLLETGGYNTKRTPNRFARNGCSPGQPMADQVDRFRNELLAFSRWPCKFDTKEARQTVPLIEQLSGKEAHLTCWVISSHPPRVQWLHLKDGKTYPVTAVKIPALKDVWQAHLYLHRVTPEKHNGAWSCRVERHNHRGPMEIPIALHVISLSFTRNGITHQSGIAENPTEYTINVPEGGTLLLSCQINSEETTKTDAHAQEFLWSRIKFDERNGTKSSPVILANGPLLHIKPVNSSQHEGFWYCQNVKHFPQRGNQYPQKFRVIVEKPPVQLSNQTIKILPVSKDQHTQRLHCDAVDLGRPTGKLTWIRCPPGENCTQIHSSNALLQQLIIHPFPGERYTCRIENTWGFIEQQFFFKYLR